MNDIQRYAVGQYIYWKRIEPEMDFRVFCKFYLKDDNGDLLLGK